MKSVRVAGMFQVTLDVVDKKSGSTGTIDSHTRGCRNVVIVKNICTLPKQVGVQVSLPNRTTSAEFVVGGSGQSRWNDQTSTTIASGGTTTLGCPLRRTSGPNSIGEPIQLDILLSSDGPPKPLLPVHSKRLPFQTTIDAM